MLEFIAGRVIALIEHELEKHAPEIEQAIIEQIETLGKIVLEYVKEVVGEEPEKSDGKIRSTHDRDAKA